MIPQKLFSTFCKADSVAPYTLHVLDESVHRYAILSHRWETDEFSFKDVTSGSLSWHTAGFRKISDFCTEACQLGFNYAWSDTCCINKDSSAELQEAINSMFRWYQQAAICLVYLSDVGSTRKFEDSQWFTRGWTLQGLIAPKRLRFYNRQWENIVHRHDLAESLSQITSIVLNALNGDQKDLSRFTIAQRMSWANGRFTTRVEDRAYSLLGIFDISMPMLYGKGEKAFFRLQKKILGTTSDQSILAWTDIRHGACEVLAPSPDYFPRSKTGSRWNRSVSFVRRGPQAMTSEGLE